jgi:predicted phage tail component-like protein
MSYIELHGTLFDASFDGINLSTKGFDCFDIKKPHIPKQQLSTIDIPKRNGNIISGKKFVQNKLVLYGYVKNDSYDDLTATLEDLAAFLFRDTDCRLVSSRQTDRYWNVQYLDYEIMEQKDDYAVVTLNFECIEDPFAYDTTATTDSQTITTFGTIYMVINGGHTYAFPVITITFNADQQHIYICNNTIIDKVSNRLDISKPFSTGDELTIDCKNGTIKLNGANSPAGLGDGGDEMAEWIMLAVGDNEIEVGTTDGTIDVTVDISFEKVYLY